MSKTTQENPLKGLSVPSVAEMVQMVMQSFGIATIDLAKPEDREKFQKALHSSLERVLRWELQEPLEKATSKAVAHVLSLMGNQNYQELRKMRQAASLERRRAKAVVDGRQRKIEIEAHRQKRKGLLQ